MQKENILELKNIKVHCSGLKALDDVDVYLNEGEKIILI